MTVGDILRVVDATKQNEYDDVTKIGWINEVEGMVYCETGTDAEFVPVCSSSDGVSLSEPYSRIYFLYIYAMMCLSKSEYEEYSRLIEQFDKAFAQYAKFIIRNR